MLEISSIFGIIRHHECSAAYENPSDGVAVAATGEQTSGVDAPLGAPPVGKTLICEYGEYCRALR